MLEVRLDSPKEKTVRTVMAKGGKRSREIAKLMRSLTGYGGGLEIRNLRYGLH